MAVSAKKVNVQSKIGAVLIHNGITIMPGEIVMIDSKLAEELIEKKFVREIKVKEL